MVRNTDRKLTLTEEQQAFLDRCVASGRYGSADEVVRAGLRLLADEEAMRQAELERVKTMIETGAAELDRGQGTDADTVFRRLLVRRERLRQASEAG